MLYRSHYLLLICLLSLFVLPPAGQPTAHTTFAALPAPIAQAGETTTGLEFATRIGGNIATVAISGTLAFVGEGAALAVLDISDPAAPALRARLPLPGIAHELQLVDSLAYIADDQGGLQIVDVRDPLHPHSMPATPRQGQCWHYR